ncbi:MAG: rhomboid family intramembrane serine protease [Alphaproteobacteria bacterium]
MRAKVKHSPGQPVFFVPGAVVVLIGILILTHALRSILAPGFDRFVVVMFGVLPARYMPGVISAFPGGIWSAIPPFITYAFLHADFTHLAINCAWLLAFGSAVARQIGSIRFIILYLMCAIFAAMMHVLVDYGSLTPMVGASGAISGMMGAAFRGAVFDALEPSSGPAGYGPRTAISRRMRLLPLNDPRFLRLSGIWALMNVVFGLTGIRVSEHVLLIAWDAHLAGFAAGVLLIGHLSDQNNTPVFKSA